MIHLKSRREIKAFIFILVGIMIIGIGYAAVTNISLNISGSASAEANQANFKVHFDRGVQPTITAGKGSATIDEMDDKKANITVTGLSKKGDTAVATYTIVNESEDLIADLDVQLTNTNPDDFAVSAELSRLSIGKGEKSVVTITVELLKTPTTNTVSTSITALVNATPSNSSNAG